MKWMLTISAFLIGAALASAADSPVDYEHQWPQWRGPQANGTAPHGDPPLKWDEKTNIRWKTPIPGEGNATPIVWGDQVFVLTAVRSDRTLDALPPLTDQPPGGYKTERPKNYYRFEVLSIDRPTGRVRWQRTATERVPYEGHHNTNTYASGSPITDGKRLYASFGSQGVFCYDLEGNLQWQRDLGRMITRLGWGEGVSPALYGDALIVNRDQERGSFLTVLDAATGETRWKADRNEVSSWSTPLVVPFGGAVQVIVAATRRVVSYDLATGKILWECGGQTVNVIPSPVRFRDTVIAISGYQGSAAYAIPLDSKGDLTGTDRVAWHRTGGMPYVPSPLLYGDRLYFTKVNTPTLTCLDAATGKPLSENQRLPGMKTLYASAVGAAGRVYFVSREGTALVIKDQPKLEVLATNQLDEGIDASPAIVGGQLFLRGKGHLYCIGK